MSASRLKLKQKKKKKNHRKLRTRESYKTYLKQLQVTALNQCKISITDNTEKGYFKVSK